MKQLINVNQANSWIILVCYFWIFLSHWNVSVIFKSSLLILSKLSLPDGKEQVQVSKALALLTTFYWPLT